MNIQVDKFLAWTARLAGFMPTVGRGADVDDVAPGDEGERGGEAVAPAGRDVADAASE